jgi:tetratricopeptide (TPR) repeat protein
MAARTESLSGSVRAPAALWAASLLLGSLLGGCTLFSPPAHLTPPAPQPGSAAEPGPGEAPSAPAPRTFHLSAAGSALVSQAHRQAGSGDYEQAAATLERALRIEPDNPLLWIELGRDRLGQKDAAQADALGHKALSLAAGDPRAQAASWRLIADALRARGRNQEAVDAEHRAQALSAQ